MKKYLGLAIISSLTLGLAPFTPEPHIWKQFLNLKLGREMFFMDWIDILLHGTPWVFLIVVLISMLREKRPKK